MRNLLLLKCTPHRTTERILFTVNSTGTEEIQFSIVRTSTYLFQKRQKITNGLHYEQKGLDDQRCMV